MKKNQDPRKERSSYKSAWKGTPPETRNDDEQEGSGTETGTVALSDDGGVFSAAKATFSALTTAAKKAGSGTFVAGKIAATGELVEAVDE